MSSERRGLDRFADDAQAWRAAAGARAPSYDRLLDAAAAIVLEPADATERAARARLEAAWRERRFAAAYDRPLLLMAALRAEAARVGPTHPLYAALSHTTPRPEAATRPALAAALADAPARLFAALATRWVQTNESSRAVAWLWPAFLAGCAGGARPLAVADIGCSAGLNLIADSLPPLWSDPAGVPLPVVTGARTVARLGFDARPLDVRRDDDVAWLRACVWPGDGARLDRLDEAVGTLRAALAAPGAPVIAAADVTAVPERLAAAAAGLPGDAVIVAYQTVVRDYLPAPVRERHAQGMHAWVAAGQARVWIELEAGPDGWDQGPHAQTTPMALTAHVRAPDGQVRALTLARCGYHPTLIVPDPAAVAAFQQALTTT